MNETHAFLIQAYDSFTEKPQKMSSEKVPSELDQSWQREPGDEKIKKIGKFVIR